MYLHALGLCGSISTESSFLSSHEVLIAFITRTTGKISSLIRVLVSSRVNRWETIQTLGFWPGMNRLEP